MRTFLTEAEKRDKNWARGAADATCSQSRLRTDRLAYASPPYRAWLGDNGEPLTVQKELMRHASIQTTLNTYGRDDGLDAGSAWADGEAGDGALMDVSGRQRIA